MALDPGRRARAGLDDVGVQRPLHEIARAAMLARRLLEHPDELLADDAPLPLRVLHARELRQEPVGRLHVHQRHAEVPGERVLDLFGLPLAQQAGVHEHARQLVVDRLVHEECGHRGVDAAGERAQHLGVPHLRADALHAPLDHVGRRPVR